MEIQVILSLVLVSLVLGLLSRQWGRTNLILVSSLLLMHWLQPETTLRHWGYWAPALSLLVIILAWMAITPADIRKSAGTYQTLFLIISLEILIWLVGNLDPGRVLGFSAAPGIGSNLVFWILLMSGSYALTRRPGNSPVLSWLVFSILIGVFIILKTPPLARYASQAWRMTAGQSPGLASGAELQWLGYSYIAFRLLHTVRDHQLGRLAPNHLNEFIAYAIFFPSIVAGPIARLPQVQEGLHAPAESWRDDLLSGSQRVLTGLIKKYLLADSLAVFALNSQNALQASSSVGAWVLLYGFSFQIYLDFSGYTDIAIGLARYLGVQLPENFNRPYLKPNLTQFWSNWHMTLTNWFRAYFFNPISRSLRKRKLPALAILLITQISTMVLVGLWHGITLNFVIWGLWHGLGLLIQNRWSAWIKGWLPPPGERPSLQKALQITGTALTFHYVTLGWIWFTLPSPGLAHQFLLRLFGIEL